MQHTPRVLAINAGGTMCDTFIIDDQGHFVVGKAQTTPEDESRGFLSSCQDALGYWKLAVAEGLPEIQSGVYAGTAMLNRLLERGLQTYLGYSYSDRLHLATHVHNEPLVPHQGIRGIRERIDLFGDTVIP